MTPIFETRFGSTPFALCIACAAPYTGRPSHDGWGSCPPCDAQRKRDNSYDGRRIDGVKYGEYGKAREKRLRDEMCAALRSAVARKVSAHRIATEAPDERFSAGRIYLNHPVPYWMSRILTDTKRNLESYVTLA